MEPVRGHASVQFGLQPGGSGPLVGPIFDYSHASGDTVVTGGYVYRGTAIGGLNLVRLSARGLGAPQTFHVTLMEDDGTSWTAAVSLDSTWKEVALPIADFKAGRGVLLPQGFPGQWNYGVGPAEGRGGAGDGVRLEHLERLQLSLRDHPGSEASQPQSGVEVAWLRLERSSRP